LYFFKAHMFTDAETLQLLAFVIPLCIFCGALALIDIRRGIIPNRLNLAVAGLGLVRAVVGGGAAAGIAATAEGVAIGAIFWMLQWLYYRLRKRPGLGLGDVKFLAAAGVWVGVGGLPLLLLIATLTALAAAGAMQMAGQSMTRQTSLPFGPFLAIGLLLTIVLRQFAGVA
jgi:leader peptidase (prepilin peptidase)/N-methyltransferase